MENDNIHEDVPVAVFGLDIELTEALKDGSSREVDAATKEVVSVEKVLQDALHRITQMKARVHNFRATGSDTVIPKGQNDF